MDYLSTKEILHTRGIRIDEKQYLFVLLCVIGERPEVAYSMVYDAKEFKLALDTEEDEEFIASHIKDAQGKLELQEEKQLFDLLASDYKSVIQAKAMNLEDFSFTTGQVVQILQNLLHSRTQDIESSSVRDIISLINTLASQGALESGDNFESHFIHILPPFNALCINCSREFDCFPGIHAKCPHCGQQYIWHEDERRFFPQPAKL